MVNVKERVRSGRISSDMFELLESFYYKQLANQSKKKEPIFRFGRKKSDEEVTLQFAREVFLSHIKQENPNQVSTCTKKFWFEYMEGNIDLIVSDVKIVNAIQATVVLRDNGLSVNRNADGTYSIMLTEDDCVVYSEKNMISYAN